MDEKGLEDNKPWVGVNYGETSMSLYSRTFKDMLGAGKVRSHACSHVLVVFDVMVDEVQVQS